MLIINYSITFTRKLNLKKDENNQTTFRNSTHFFSCTRCLKKEEPEVIVLPPIDNPTPTSSISTFFDNNLESEIQIFTINPSTNYMVTGINGTTLFFNANTFEDMNGNTVSGPIELK